MLHAPGPRLDLDERHRSFIHRRAPEGQIHPGRQLDRTADQPDPHRLLRARKPTGGERRPTLPQPIDLALHLRPELRPPGGLHPLDPGGELALAIIQAESDQAVDHGIADGAHRDQLPEQHVDECPAGQGGGRLPFAELGGDLVPLAGQHAAEPVLGHHERGTPVVGTPVQIRGQPLLQRVADPGGQLRIGRRTGPPGDPQPLEQGLPRQRLPCVRPWFRADAGGGEGFTGPTLTRVRPSRCSDLPGSTIDLHHRHVASVTGGCHTSVSHAGPGDHR